MNRLLYILLVLLLFVSCREDNEQTIPEGFQPEVMLGMTPVKDQGNSDLCWVFAMLATIESEHIGRGDSVNLSTDFVARMWIAEQALQRYRSAGEKEISMRGMSPMTLTLLRRYGAMPYDSYYSREPVNYRVLVRRVEQTVDMALLRHKSEEQCRKEVDELLDENIGFMPRLVFMYGCQYTFLEFAHSVYEKGEYQSLTNLKDYPYGEEIVLPFADNHYHCKALNVPSDSLIVRIEQSLADGHPVMWEGGDNDDHAACVIGMGRDRCGNEYFVAKNSWGSDNETQGMLYLSKPYVASHTAVVVVKDRFVLN